MVNRELTSRSALLIRPPKSTIQWCSETAKLDRFWVEFSAVIPKAGGDSQGWEERRTMKASGFSNAQKAFILKQGADGMPVADICRKAGISQATYFNWKRKYDGLAAGRAPPKALKPVRKRKLVDEMRGDWDVSSRRACRVFLVDTSTYHTNLVAPDRLPSNDGSRRSARLAFATVIGAFTYRCGGRAGGSIKRRRGASIAN
jgi:hypothetical protein